NYKKTHAPYRPMQLLGYTPYGLEQQAVDDLETVTDADVTHTAPGRVLLDGDGQTVFRANYLAGSCARFIELLADFTLHEPGDAYEALETDISDLIKPDETFAVRVTRQGDHDFSSPDIARQAGQAIVDLYEEQQGETLSVDLDDPDRVFRLDLFGDDAYLGIDTTGDSLNQRPYLRTDEPRTPPVLANCLVRASDWQPGDSLLDPFCGAGIIPIEAGRIECNIPNASRKFAFMDIERYDMEQYAAVAQQAKQDMDIHDVDLRGSDEHLDSAEQSAKASGLELSFQQIAAPERDLDADHILFHAPFIQQRSKREQIKDVVQGVEEDLLDQGLHGAAFSQDSDFFQQPAETFEAGFDGLDGWVARW
ncbi:MAG: THUMP domain-containing protein, partial [Candidatus Nanohaloarchaea archaeon]|nr:THUMP domain-containing protein [Candidatus Nanohaloarchaea archaeon]